MTTGTKRTIAAIFGLLVVVGALGGIKAAQIGTMIGAGKSFAPRPESVTSAKVEGVEWQEAKPAIGSLVAIHAVTLSAELPGLVREIAFDSGQSIKRGQVMVKLDTSTEEAQLEAAQADAALAKINLDRIRNLRKMNASTPSELDIADARAKQADAAVANLKAIIAKKTIRAPFDGRVAIRQAELGQVLSPGTPIASLHSVSPIYAEFWVEQQALRDLKLGQEVRVRTDAFPDSTWEGKVTTINPEVDTATRNVRIRATVPNNDARLRPGMFVNVDLLSPEKRPMVIIPATAVLFAPYGDSLFVLEEKKDDSGKTITTVHQKFVRLGQRKGDMVEVISGVEPGETVVSSGAFKLRNGMAVTVKNDLAPNTQVAPKPVDK